MTDYKILGQAAPGSNVFENVYSAPSGKSALVRATNIANTSSTSDKISVVVYDESNVVEQRQLFIKQSSTKFDISKDGIIWQTISKNVNGITNSVISPILQFGPYVLANNYNSIAKTQDLVNWTVSTIPSLLSLGLTILDAASSPERAVVSGQYGSYATSTDLINWVSTSNKIGFLGNSSSNITYGDGKFVSFPYFSNNVTNYSTDGINWIAGTQTLPSSHRARFGQVIYAGGKFVAATRYSNVLSSTDGLTWTLSSANIDGYIPHAGIAYGNGKFVVVARSYGGDPYISTSTDAITWTATTVPEFQYSSTWAIAFGSNKFVAPLCSAYTELYAYSTDAITWTNRTFPSSSLWHKITSDGTNFLVISQEGNTAYSTDGLSWTAGTLPESFWGSAFELAYLKYVGNKYIVSGYFSDGKNKAYISTNGISWTINTAAPFTANVTSFDYNGTGTFVVLPNNYDTPYSSTDLISFNAPYVDPAIGNNKNISRLAYGAGVFVGLDSLTNDFAYSTNGINWIANTLPQNINALRVIYANSKFVATGLSNLSLTSTDGISWSVGTMPTTSNWLSIAFGSNAFVSTSASGLQYAAYSTNGIVWTSVTLPSGQWRYVSYGDNKFVAVGLAAGAYSSIFGISAHSSDGITWTLSEYTKYGSFYNSSPIYVEASYVNLPTTKDMIFDNYEVLGNETVTVKGGHILEEGQSLEFVSKNGTSSINVFGGEI